MPCCARNIGKDGQCRQDLTMMNKNYIFLWRLVTMVFARIASAKGYR